MFHFHKWSDWAIKEKGKVHDKWGQQHQLGSYITQERYCHHCGKTQINTQKTVMLTDVFLVPDQKQTVPKHDVVK